MASRSATLDRYRLDTVFDGDLIRHTVVKSNPQTRQRKVTVKTAWKGEADLGSGIFGTWIQREEGSGELRVVKTVPQIQACDWEVVLEEFKELREHPDLFVSFLGWFEDPYAIHLAMEYVEGGDLGLYIEECGATTGAKDDIGEITSQILEGLAVLHQEGICHPDLKPQSILIVSRSPIWIKINNLDITDKKFRCGIVCYRAPEEMGLLPKKFKHYDLPTGASNMWALGAMVHQILTSEVPFIEADHKTPAFLLPPEHFTNIDMELIVNYCRGQDPFPTEVLQKKGVSTQGIDFVRGLMAIDPRARPSAADALKNPWLVRIHAQAVSASVSPVTSLPSPPALAPPPTIIPSTAPSMFDAQVVASLTGDRRRLFIAEANTLILAVVMSSVSYGPCNRQLVEFCRSNKLVGARADYDAQGYSHWALLAQDKQEPRQALELWSKAVAARGGVEHWELLVIRALSDLLASFA